MSGFFEIGLSIFLVFIIVYVSYWLHEMLHYVFAWRYGLKPVMEFWYGFIPCAVEPTEDKVLSSKHLFLCLYSPYVVNIPLFIIIMLIGRRWHPSIFLGAIVVLGIHILSIMRGENLNDYKQELTHD